MNQHLKFVVIILIVLSSRNAFAQKDEDVSKKAASSSYSKFRKRGASDATTLLQQAERLKQKDPGAALEKVKEALGLSIANEDDASEAKCYNLIGEINEQIGEWKLAEENYFEAYKKNAAGTPGPELFRSLQGLGNTVLRQGHYGDAIQWFQMGIALKPNSIVNTNLRLGLSEAHYLSRDYAAALSDIESLNNSSSKRGPDQRIENQRVKIRTRMQDPNADTKLYSNSINSIRSNQPVNAEERESLQKTKEDLVGILREQNRGSDEIALRKQSIEFNTATQNMSEVAKDKVELSKTLAAEGQSAESLRELESAVKIADTINNIDTKSKALLALAQQYEKLGRQKEAIQLYRRYSNAIAEKDTLRQTQLLAKADLIRQQRDIEAVTKTVALGQREERIAQARMARQQLIIYGLLFVILVIAVTSWFLYRSVKATRRANGILALKSLRNQMNPHFIFNALNSVNQFIALQDERTANKFLTDLSRLMRLVLENSQEDFIPLTKEIEILQLYTGLEHYRFRDKFEYTFDVDPAIQQESVLVPPMLIQPYIENAVWHGLRYRETPGKLQIAIRPSDDNIIVEIIDDGIGRKKSAELKTANQKKHSSTALKNIQERIEIINKIYQNGYSVTVTDLDTTHGTSVKLVFPAKTT